MIRRQFLKLLAAIPFVGKLLPAVEKEFPKIHLVPAYPPSKKDEWWRRKYPPTYVVSTVNKYDLSCISSNEVTADEWHKAAQNAYAVEMAKLDEDEVSIREC